MQFAVEGYLLILCLGLFSPATGTLELTAQGFQLWNHNTHTNMYYYSSTGGCNLQNAECRTQQRIKSAVLCNKQNKHLLKTPLLHILPLHVQSLNPNQRKEGIIWHSFCRLMAGILHGIPLVLWLPCLQYDTVSNKCTSSCWVPFTAKSPLRTSKRHHTSHVVITTSPILRRKKKGAQDTGYYYPRPTGLNFCDFGVTDQGWHVINCPLPLLQGAHTKDAKGFQTPHEALFVSGQTSDRCHSAMFVNPQPLPHPSLHVHIWKKQIWHEIERPC